MSLYQFGELFRSWMVTNDTVRLNRYKFIEHVKYVSFLINRYNKRIGLVDSKSCRTSPQSVFYHDFDVIDPIFLVVSRPKLPNN